MWNIHICFIFEFTVSVKREKTEERSGVSHEKYGITWHVSSSFTPQEDAQLQKLAYSRESGNHSCDDKMAHLSYHQPKGRRYGAKTHRPKSDVWHCGIRSPFQ